MVCEVGEDHHAHADRDSPPDHHSVRIGRLDQRVEADPRVFTDLHAAKPVQLHARRVSTWRVQRDDLQEAVADPCEAALHDPPLLRST